MSLAKIRLFYIFFIILQSENIIKFLAMFMHMNVSLTFEYILIANFLKNNFKYCKIKSIEIVTCRYFSLIFRGCPTEVRDNCRSYRPPFFPTEPRDYVISKRSMYCYCTVNICLSYTLLFWLQYSSQSWDSIIKMIISCLAQSSIFVTFYSIWWNFK